MNSVYIVMKNGKVDQVFNNYEAAVQHQKNLIKKWSLSEIIEKEVQTL